jgi:hypothetical protein
MPANRLPTAALAILVALALGVPLVAGGLAGAGRDLLPAAVLVTLTAFPAAFVALDLVFFKWRGESQAEGTPRQYHPSLKLWGLGAALGAVAGGLVLVGHAAAGMREAPSNADHLWQNLALIAVPALLLACIVWALVKIALSD